MTWKTSSSRFVTKAGQEKLQFCGDTAPDTHATFLPQAEPRTVSPVQIPARSPVLVDLHHPPGTPARSPILVDLHHPPGFQLVPYTHSGLPKLWTQFPLGQISGSETGTLQSFPSWYSSKFLESCPRVLKYIFEAELILTPLELPLCNILLRNVTLVKLNRRGQMGGGAVKGFYKDSSYPIKLQG